MEEITGAISSFIWGWPMIVMLLGTHLYLTIRLKFPQRYIFKAIGLSFKKEEGEGDVSHFASLATSLAATIGTGNIIGVATAVALGGPGAVLWCWLTGVFGIATKYAEGLLAVRYRQKTKRGMILGGPMYVIEKGMNCRWLAVLFCVFTVAASFGIGNTIQSNAIATIVTESTSIPAWAIGIVLTILAGLVIIKGVKGISRVCSVLVPIMAVFYILSSLYILFLNRSVLGESISLIFSSAFTARAAGGGFAGSTVMMACRYGIARGLFSNESGMGSAPIVAAAAKTKNPVRQALVSSTGTFWDTVIICAITGLVLVSSIVMHPDISSSDGASLTRLAFAKIPAVGTPIMVASIIAFAFSTILGWSYYAEKALEYLTRGRGIRAFRIVFVLMVFVGSIANLSTVWNLADIMNALMAIPNLISLVVLAGVSVSLTGRFLWNGKMDDRFEDGD